MANLKFVNFFSSKIANVGGISASAVAVDLTAGDGSKLQALAAGEYYYGCIIDQSANREIVKITGVSSDQLTIVRGQDNTLARVFLQGDIIEIRLNAKTLEDIQAGVESNSTEIETINAAVNSLGSIATQDLDDVDIDGGTIDGVQVGVYVQAPGVFSILRAFSDPADGYGVGNRDYNDSRYSQIPVGGEYIQFPSGTSMLFEQASPPTGWTKKTNWSNVASLIIGNTYGSGGDDSPTSWGTDIAIGDHADHNHSGPSHRHSYSGIINHTHNVPLYTGVKLAGTGSAFTPYMSSGGAANLTASNPSGGASSADTEYSGTGNTGNTSTPAARTHSITQATYAPRYQTVIAASKQ